MPTCFTCDCLHLPLPYPLTRPLLSPSAHSCTALCLDLASKQLLAGWLAGWLQLHACLTLTADRCPRVGGCRLQPQVGVPARGPRSEAGVTGRARAEHAPACRAEHRLSMHRHAQAQPSILKVSLRLCFCTSSAICTSCV